MQVLVYILSWLSGEQESTIHSIRKWCVFSLGKRFYKIREIPYSQTSPLCFKSLRIVIVILRVELILRGNQFRKYTRITQQKQLHFHECSRCSQLLPLCKWYIDFFHFSIWTVTRQTTREPVASQFCFPGSPEKLEAFLLEVKEVAFFALATLSEKKNFRRRTSAEPNPQVNVKFGVWINSERLFLFSRRLS